MQGGGHHLLFVLHIGPLNQILILLDEIKKLPLKQIVNRNGFKIDFFFLQQQHLHVNAPLILTHLCNYIESKGQLCINNLLVNLFALAWF